MVKIFSQILTITLLLLDYYILFSLKAEKILLSDKRNVLFADEHVVETTFVEYPCSIVQSKSTYAKYAMAFPFARDSPFVHLFNYQINHVWEGGLKSRYFKRAHLYKKLSVCPTEDESFEPFSYHNIISAFVIIGCGILIAVTCSFIELFAYQSKKRL